MNPDLIITSVHQRNVCSNYSMYYSEKHKLLFELTYVNMTSMCRTNLTRYMVYFLVQGKNTCTSIVNSWDVLKQTNLWQSVGEKKISTRGVSHQAHQSNSPALIGTGERANVAKARLHSIHMLSSIAIKTDGFCFRGQVHHCRVVSSSSWRIGSSGDAVIPQC
jgi:hypothetical protein